MCKMRFGSQRPELPKNVNFEPITRGLKKMSGYYRGAYFFQNAKYVSLKLFLGCIHIKYDAYYIEYF